MLDNCWVIVVSRWPRVRNVRLAVLSTNEPFAYKGPTTIQALASQNTAQIRPKFEKSLYLPNANYKERACLQILLSTILLLHFPFSDHCRNRHGDLDQSDRPNSRVQ